MADGEGGGGERVEKAGGVGKGVVEALKVVLEDKDLDGRNGG